MEKSTQNGLVSFNDQPTIRQTPEQYFVKYQPIEDWLKNLTTYPDEHLVKTNPFADNARYLPISTVETQLDELFFGLWKTENFRWQVVANEIVGSLDLHYLHPVAGVWLVRTGVGSVMIQQDGYKKDELGQYINGSDGKRQKINPRPSDVDAKIKNTLVKDFPHLKSECLKNAAKSLGNMFGRNLNRKDQDIYAPGLPNLMGAVRKRALEEKSMPAMIEKVKREGVGAIRAIQDCFALTSTQLETLENTVA